MAEFSAHTAELWERFRTTGPGLPTVELPAGVDELHKYESDLADALRQREALVLAEKLFDMEITAYPELAQLEMETRKLGQVGVGVFEAGPGGSRHGQGPPASDLRSSAGRVFTSTVRVLRMLHLHTLAPDEL